MGPNLEGKARVIGRMSQEYGQFMAGGLIIAGEAD